MNLGENKEKGELDEMLKKGRLFLGGVLSIIGILISLFIFATIYKLIKSPEEIALFNRMFPEGYEVGEMWVGKESVQLPMGIFYFFAYLIGGLLLWIAARIGIELIRVGAGLIYPRVDRLEAKLYRETEKLRNKIAKVKTSIPRVLTGVVQKAGGETHYKVERPPTPEEEDQEEEP